MLAQIRVRSVQRADELFNFHFEPRQPFAGGRAMGRCPPNVLFFTTEITENTETTEQNMKSVLCALCELCGKNFV